MPTRYEKLTTRLQNHRVVAVLLVVGTIVIAISSFTDSTKNLISLFSKPDPEEARMKLASLAVPFTAQEFVESAARGDLTLVKLFLAAGMDPNVVLEGGPTALFLAARENQPAAVDALMSGGAKIMNGESNGLEAAAQSGNLTLVNQFLKVHATRAQLNAALVAAKDQPTVERLIVAGADLKEAGAETLFYSSDPAAVAFLRSHGVSLNTKDAHQHSFVERLDLGNVSFDTLKRLIDRGADLNAHDANGETLLTGMVRRGYIEGVEMLLAGSSHVDQPNSSGRTPLSLACEPKTAHAIEIANLLLQHGAAVGVRDQAGKTALTYARANSNPELVQVLVDHGAQE